MTGIAVVTTRLSSVTMNTASEVIASAHRAFGVIPCPVPAASGAATAAGRPTGSSGFPAWVAGSVMATHVPSNSRTEPVGAVAYESRDSPAPRVAATAAVEARQTTPGSPVSKMLHVDLRPNHP